MKKVFLIYIVCAFFAMWISCLEGAQTPPDWKEEHSANIVYILEDKSLKDAVLIDKINQDSKKSRFKYLYKAVINGETITIEYSKPSLDSTIVGYYNPETKYFKVESDSVRNYDIQLIFVTFLLVLSIGCVIFIVLLSHRDDIVVN